MRAAAFRAFGLQLSSVCGEARDLLGSYELLSTVCTIVVITPVKHNGYVFTYTYIYISIYIFEYTYIYVCMCVYI